ncbi:MAG TPA: radical SAM protein [Candidatus Methylomirabilis sp.]|nr:radical SAM protein [Candidatus Methylomirabilis sp.]
MGRVDFRTYVVMSIWFGCNNDCSICMLGEMKRNLPAIDFDGFRSVTTAIMREGRFENLILSGGEVTTFGDLETFSRFAASLGWFKRIQIQTNGRRLHDKRYVQHLIDCGINEFFVSVYGLDAVHDAVTGIPGSYQETMEGLAHLEEYDVNVISNTVLTKSNVQDIPRLMRVLSSRKISEMQLWNYFPMERTDSKDLVVSLVDLMGLLRELHPVCREAKKPLVLKSFPECLFLNPPVYVDNLFPATVLPDPFWRQFSENGFGWCTYRDVCASRTCWALSRAYVGKYGDARHLLSPLKQMPVVGGTGAAPGGMRYA